MKPGIGKKSFWEYSVPEGGIPSKQEALCVEAWWAAIRVAAEPLIARGGPWSRLTWSDATWAQIKRAAKLAATKTCST